MPGEMSGRLFAKHELGHRHLVHDRGGVPHAGCGAPAGLVQEAHGVGRSAVRRDGDRDRGYKAIDISGKDERLYCLTCPLMVGQYIVAIPKYSKGTLQIVAKTSKGQPLM